MGGSEAPRTAESELLTAMCGALGIDAAGVEITGAATLDSAYPVSDLAAATVATAATAVAELCAAVDLPVPRAEVDRGLVDGWSGSALIPIGWTIPSPWDSIAGDYPCMPGSDESSGWIRLHTDAPHHRAAALRVLGVDGDRARVAEAVSRWTGDDLEDAVVAAGGCAATLRSADAWARPRAGRRGGRGAAGGFRGDGPGRRVVGRGRREVAPHDGAAARRAAGARPDAGAQRTGGDALPGGARRRRAARRSSALG